MDLNAIVETQHAFDAAHGWSLKGNDPRDLITMLGTDLVGLLGEIGEFANLVKKLQRDQAGLDSATVTVNVDTVKPQLEEELVDTFIYVARMAAHLGVNLEEAYRRKLKLNEVRYASRMDPKAQ